MLVYSLKQISDLLIPANYNWCTPQQNIETEGSPSQHTLAMTIDNRADIVREGYSIFLRRRLENLDFEQL